MLFFSTAHFLNSHSHNLFKTRVFSSSPPFPSKQESEWDLFACCLCRCFDCVQMQHFFFFFFFWLVGSWTLILLVGELLMLWPKVSDVWGRRLSICSFRSLFNSQQVNEMLTALSLCSVFGCFAESLQHCFIYLFFFFNKSAVWGLGTLWVIWTETCLWSVAWL